MRLNIQESGKGPCLVLIHGWAMNNLVWGDWLSDLEKSYRVICVELPGHGDSDYSQRWTMTQLLEAMAAQLPSRCSVLGWSLGGMVALAYSGKYPQRVNRLILLASSAKFVQSNQWRCAQSEETLKAFSRGLLSRPLITIKRFIKLQTQGLASSKRLNDFLSSIVKVSDKGASEGLFSGLDVLCHGDFRELLKNLTCPMLMVLGEKDQLVPVEVAEQSLHINPNIDTLTIEGATHIPFLSHRSDVSQALDQFMLAVERSS
jgi:pimeloyl-[acyl-carrier protein] methyl ester esterase